MKYLSILLILAVTLFFSACEDTRHNDESSETDTTVTKNLRESKSSGDVKHPEDEVKKKD